MINDPTFGPLFDPQDGTVGHLQLKKRWAITRQRQVWPQAKAAFMYTQLNQAEEHLKLMEIADLAVPSDLQVRAWWCWPASLCPAYLDEREGLE